MKNKKKEISIVISDLQLPHEHPSALPFTKMLAKHVGANTIYNIGDTFDFTNWGRWAKAKRPPALISHEEEIFQNQAKVKEWAKAFPEMKLIIGNHCMRFINDMRFAAGIPKSIMSDSEIMYTFMGTPKGWSFHKNLIVKTPGTLADIHLLHGHSNGVTKIPATWFRNSTLSGVIGHYHSDAKIEYSADIQILRFFAVVGCLMDSKSLGAEYAEEDVRKQVYSCLVINDGVPQLYPMRIGLDGEWEGRI